MATNLSILFASMCYQYFIASNNVLPILPPFDGYNPCSVVVVDNASIQHVERVYIITLIGAQLLFLSPYSPDLRPLEVFAQVIAMLKANECLLVNMVTRTIRILYSIRS